MGDTHGPAARGDHLRGEWDPDRIAQAVANLIVNALRSHALLYPGHYRTQATGRQVRLPRARMVEEHDAVSALERQDAGPPHVLIATKAMREHHRQLTVSDDVKIVPLGRRRAQGRE